MERREEVGDALEMLEPVKKLVTLGADGAKVVADDRLILSCKNCDTKLVEIQPIDKNAKNRDGSPIKWALQAECYKCGSTSFEKEVFGRFSPAPYGVTDPNDPDDVILECCIADIVYLPNCKQLFKTLKVN